MKVIMFQDIWKTGRNDFMVLGEFPTEVGGIQGESKKDCCCLSKSTLT